ALSCPPRSSLLPPSRPPTSPLFPYTPLFRSPAPRVVQIEEPVAVVVAPVGAARRALFGAVSVALRIVAVAQAVEVVVRAVRARRSEEHTSELQSRENLVCRLLLEKKKKINYL